MHNAESANRYWTKSPSSREISVFSLSCLVSELVICQLLNGLFDIKYTAEVQTDDEEIIQDLKKEMFIVYDVREKYFTPSHIYVYIYGSLYHRIMWF